MEGRQEEILAWAEGAAYVDKDGIPVLWLHATDVEGFNVFCHWGEFSLGFHFGGPEAANARLKDINEGDLLGGSIIPVWCRARHPLRLPDLYTWSQRDVCDALVEAGVIEEEDAEFIEDQACEEAIFAAIEEAGCDSIVYGNLCEHKEAITDSLCVWRAELLKSPFASSFDRNDPRLMPQLVTDPNDLRTWRDLAKSIDRAKEELRAYRGDRATSFAAV